MNVATKFKYKFVGYALMVLGLLTYFAVVLKMIKGEIVPFINIVGENSFILVVVSLILISVTVAFFPYGYYNKLSGLGGFLFLVSILLMVVNHLAKYNIELALLSESLMLLGIAFISVSASLRRTYYGSIIEPKEFKAIDTITSKTGSGFKSLSSTLAIYWVINKLIAMAFVNMIFISEDYLLFTAFTSYIIGSALESYGATYPISGHFSGIKSGLASAFGSALVLVILSYILMWLNLVSSNWLVLHDRLVYTTFVLLAGTIIAYLMFPGGELKHLIRSYTEERGTSEVINVSRKNGELDISDNLSIFVESGSLVSKFSLDEGDKKYEGVYITGYGVYTLKSTLGKINGSFDKVWLVWEKGDYWKEIVDTLGLTKAGYVNLEEFGFLSKEAYFDFLKSETKRISSLLGGLKKESTYIKLPFLEIYDGADKEYVKVGPLTIIETDKTSYISFGPFKIVDSSVKKLTKKKEPLMLVGVNDRDRGELIIKVYEDRVTIANKDEQLEVGDERLRVVKGSTVLSYSDDEVKVVLDNLIIKAKKDEYAKLVSGKNVIKADKSGYVKIYRDGKVIKLNDRSIAMKVIDKIYTTGLSIIKNRFTYEQKDEISSLLSYLDKLIK